MVKFVDILNKDVGSIASKVLKADVGDLVKGAGRALNTDVGTIAKGAGKVLSYDLGDLFAENKAVESGEMTAGTDSATAKTAPPVVQSPVSDSESPQAATAPIAKTETASAPARTKLTDAHVNRQTRLSPEGSNLTTLMPIKVGTFTRSGQSAQGEIATDPVSAVYSSEQESLTLTLEACWDTDEAIEKLKRRRGLLENARNGSDDTWIVGIDAHGVVFIWRREQYCYEISSPRGVSPVARFLADFPF